MNNVPPRERVARSNPEGSLAATVTAERFYNLRCTEDDTHAETNDNRHPPGDFPHQRAHTNHDNSKRGNPGTNRAFEPAHHVTQHVGQFLGRILRHRRIRHQQQGVSHEQCQRKNKPFVAINCAALPEGLIESELFGYAEGAFTGARKSGSIGRVFEADGGILFLDEIGDMSLTLQTRLLRVLQDRAVQPLGGGKSRTVNFVVLSATHRDLAAMVSAGSFRADLYYRLHFHQIDLPPLRHRNDKAAFIDALWQEAGATRRQLSLSDAARQALCNYDWPGNFRQLAHLVKTLVALAETGQTIDINNLPSEYRITHKPVSVDTPCQPTESIPPHNQDLSPERIKQALEQTHYKVAAAARRLGVHRSTLYRYMATYNL